MINTYLRNGLATALAGAALVIVPAMLSAPAYAAAAGHHHGFHHRSFHQAGHRSKKAKRPVRPAAPVAHGAGAQAGAHAGVKAGAHAGIHAGTHKPATKSAPVHAQSQHGQKITAHQATDPSTGLVTGSIYGDCVQGAPGQSVQIPNDPWSQIVNGGSVSTSDSSDTAVNGHPTLNATQTTTVGKPTLHLTSEYVDADGTHCFATFTTGRPNQNH